MNKFLTILAAISLTASTFAQAPEKMSYQAVIRDSGNTIVSNQSVGMQISVLQTTAAGTAVYVETQSPTTNANGLVSIQIGMGSVVSGDFSAIDWSAGPYFIKTETDPTGGINYTITGTTELLSVPYALHANNGIPSGGTEGQFLRIVNGEPVWVDSQVDFDGDGFTVSEGDCNDNDVTINPGILEISGDGIDNNCNGQIDEAHIGQLGYGGIVFWVDPTDNTHGLVCAIEEQSANIQWNNGSSITTGAASPALGIGTTNTAAIITAQGAVETNYAAGLAKAYTGGGFNDWFLPSKDELNAMYTNKAAINATAVANGGANFTNYAYWSSTEYGSYYAWAQIFTNGYQDYYNKNNTYIVRAVRAF